jgi:hypothetical protein
MIFIFAIDTPANTPATHKVGTNLQLSAGKITEVHLQFPPGLDGLAHISINDGLHQLWPTNPEADFCTSEDVIIFAEDIDIGPDSNSLTAYTWNLDDTYDHTITVRIVVATPEEETSWLDEAKQLLGLSSA